MNFPSHFNPKFTGDVIYFLQINSFQIDQSYFHFISLSNSVIYPIWALRLKPYLIRQLYESDAAGYLGVELLDQVGWALNARCDSFIHFLTSGRTRRPIWINLISGHLDFVVDFLDHLSYSPSSTPGTRQNLEEWREKMNWSPHWKQKRK